VVLACTGNRAYRQSPAYTQRRYAKEASAPDALCVSYTHDRDFEDISGRARPVVGKARYAETAWCREYSACERPPARSDTRVDGARGAGRLTCGALDVASWQRRRLLSTTASRASVAATATGSSPSSGEMARARTPLRIGVAVVVRRG
jgi:hypothetical protein